METIKVSRSLSEAEIEIRTQVFVIEQGFREEFDTIDKDCLHFLYFVDEISIGVARVYFSKEHNCYSIGRFAILKEYRRKRYGKKLLEYMEKYLLDTYGHIKIGLSSQKRAVPFYSACGYTQIGEMYLDENYPHYWMEKNI